MIPNELYYYQTTPYHNTTPFIPPTEDPYTIQMQIDTIQNNKNKNTSHCKIPLHILINDMLEKSSYPLALTWKNRSEQTFQVNNHHFCVYYREVGNTNARDNNIINLFSRKKDKFIKISQVPDLGYDAVYKLNCETTMNSIDDADAEKIFNQLSVDKKIVNILQFLGNLKNDTWFNIKDTDYVNLFLLLRSEAKFEDTITIDQLNYFLMRFGPLRQTLSRVDEFIESGAKDWYHGSIDREKAEEILKENYNNYKTPFYLLRSVDPKKGIIPKTLYLFSISFYDGDRLNHIRIYYDVKKILCIACKNGDKDSLSMYSDFKTCIMASIPNFHYYKPLPSEFFENLKCTNSGFHCNAIDIENINVSSYIIHQKY